MALKAEPRVVSACIYGRDNLPFAVYVRNRVASVVIPPQPQPDGSYFGPGRVLVFHQIKLDGERIGTIYIESDLDEMHERIRNYAAIVLLAMLASSAVAYLLASRLIKSFAKRCPTWIPRA